MDFMYSDKIRAYQQRLEDFMEVYIYPNEQVYEQQLQAQEHRWASVPPIIEELKEQAKAEGLWNLFLPDDEYGAG